MKCLCLSLTGLSNDLRKVSGPRQSQLIGGNQDVKVDGTKTAYLRKHKKKKTTSKNLLCFEEPTHINRTIRNSLVSFGPKRAPVFNKVMFTVFTKSS